jgi:branched-chain amino acid transport system permease protein
MTTTTGATDVAVITPPPPRRPTLRLNPSLRWPVGLLVAAVVIFTFYYLDTYFRADIPNGLHDFVQRWLPLLSVNEALIYVMAALGLNVVVGYAGLLDLGYVAFWAIGGYTVGWLMSQFMATPFPHINIRFFGSEYTRVNHIGGIHIAVWVVLIAAALLCALAGVIIGAPTLRLRSDYLALVTLGFGEIIYELFYNGDDVFGKNISNGTQGINPTDSVRFFGFDDTGKLTWKDLGPFDVLPKFLIFLVLTALLMWASLRIREGRLGRAWLAIREDELAASAMGVPLMRTKLSAYALGAVGGAIAGVAFAVHVSGVFPDRFRFDISITLLAMVVLGGMGNVWGVTVGALALAWTNSTFLRNVQDDLDASGSASTVGVVLLLLGVAALVIGGLLLLQRKTVGLLLAFIGVLVGVIGLVLWTKGASTSFEFLIFGSVLVMMMLFRREGLIPEARTRLVLREPGRTEAEALGADMEDVAPDLEALPDEQIHAGGTVPPAEGRDGTQA